MSDRSRAMWTITLWEPWASLISHGVKKVETRSWQTYYRGPLAIHASKRRFGFSSETAEFVRTWPLEVWRKVLGHADPEFCDNYPLGCVIATCDLVDIVPTDDLEWDGLPNIGFLQGWWSHGSRIDEVHTVNEAGRYVVDESQRPYGDFSPGRFAWLLGNIRPIDPVPAKGAQGLWMWEPEIERV